MQQVSQNKSVSRGEKLMYKFHEKKNQHARSFTEQKTKNQHAIKLTPLGKNQHLKKKP